jgi:hypothetical protein
MKYLFSLLVLASLFTKIGTHMHLDWRHGRFKGFAPASFQPIEYFLFYVKDVRVEFKLEKKICNIAYVILLVSMFLTFIIGFVL